MTDGDMQHGDARHADMRYGHCSVCGAHEVHRGEYLAQGGIRGTDSITRKAVAFDTYICADCGHTQFHAHLDADLQKYIHRKLQWIPPYRGTSE